MSDKPVILVTRKLPEVVEARINRDYEGRLNPNDALYSKNDLIERAQGADGILPCHTEIFDADLIGRLPDEVKIVANFSVGFDHVDIDAAKKRGLVVTNTPDVLTEDTADIRERGRIFRESSKSFDFWVDNGLALVGSPETVARKIAQGSEEIGYDHFAGKFHIGRMPHDMVEKSFQLFGREVIPAFS